MLRYFLHIAYKGSAYHGWQRQANSETVQETIEMALSKIGMAHQGILGCGRTDTGVHASQFYAHVDLDEVIKPDTLIYKLNAVLPNDIAIYEAIPVHEDAHARFDATRRTYEYHLHQRKEPFLTDRSVQHLRPLDIELMNTAAQALIGRHEFTSFARLHGAQKTDFCSVDEAFWVSDGYHLTFRISADRFLRNMVRAIVGTLMEVGLGNTSIAEFQSILESKDRGAAGASAPAHGLYLCGVEYPYIERDGKC